MDPLIWYGDITIPSNFDMGHAPYFLVYLVWGSTPCLLVYFPRIFGMGRPHLLDFEGVPNFLGRYQIY